MVNVTLTATFTTAGAFSWTAPAGVTSVVVACQAGGGGGGAAAAASGSNGGGGGGGEAALESALAVTAGNVYSGTVGAGGAAGTSGGAGGAGGATTFTGDTMTVTANGGGAGGAAGAAGDGAAGASGTGSTNLVSANGGSGDDGAAGANGGGGGGGAGVSLAAGFMGGAASNNTAGTGGGGTYPGGAGGAGSTSGAGTGSAGTAPGGGGGGAISTGTARAGGAGAVGQVVLTWVQSDPVTLSSNTSGGTYKFTAPYGATSVTAQAWGAGAGGFNTAAGGGSSGGSRGTGSNLFLSGATINRTYGLGTNRVPQTNDLDSYVGRPIGYVAQKTYYGSPANETKVDAQTLALANAGAFMLLCIEPSKTYATAGGQDDYSALQNFCTMYTAAMPANSFAIIIYQETNDHVSTPAVYQALWNHYIGAIPTSIPVWYDGAGHDMAGAIAYIPSAGPGRLPNAIGCDYYGESFNGQDLRLMQSQADTLGVAFGVFEWGASASASITLAKWNSYFTDPSRGLYTIFSNRVSSNLKTAGCVAYASLHSTDYNVIQNIATPAFPGSGATVTNSSGYNVAVSITGGNVTAVTVNSMSASTVTPGNVYQIPIGGTIVVTYTGSPSWTWADYKVPAYQAMYDLMNGSVATTPVGGAGGGGGEFAQESSLAIVDSTAYTIVVGAGGAANASGGNSTIAGQSVTVTAHGGSVASTTSSGGSGGAGSTNSTHNSGGAGGAGGVANGGGGGGGGSAGTAAGGNSGGAGTATAGGTGGAAVTGGGKGGFGGKPGANGFSGLEPGGGGGGGSSTAAVIGSGGDGQITLSSFVTNTAGPGAVALAPLALSGTGAVVTGSGLILAPLAFSATATIGAFTHLQDGSKSSGTGSCTLTLASSTAGSLLAAEVVTNGQTAFTAPAGWQLGAAQNAGGSAGRVERWYYLNNPGGAVSATFTGGAVDCRGYISEYGVGTGYIASLDVTGTASGTSGTSFPLSASASAHAGDLQLASFIDEFSSATSAQSWTTPSGWTAENSTATGVRDNFAGYWRTGQPDGVPSLTGTFSTTTNQTGWAGVVVTFNAVPLVSSANTAVALAPLAFSGTASAVVPAGNVTTSGALALAPLAIQSPSTATTFGQQGNAPLPVMVEILLNGVWTDITDYVYQRDGIQITGRGRPDEASQCQPAQCAITLNNRDGSFAPQNTAGQFYPYLVRNTQIRVSVVNAVTPQGAWYNGYRFSGEVPGWPPRWDPTGTDVTAQIVAAGVLQRLQQSKDAGSPLARYYAGLVNKFIRQVNALGPVGAPPPFSNSLVPAGYWPCEDGTASTQFASGLTGGSPMTWTGGTPTLGGDSNVAGSQPIAVTNSTAWTGTPGAFTSGGITYSTPGTYTWLCPAGVTSILAECWGGGGGGSSGSSTAGTGGGGGEYAAEPNLAVTPGTSYTLVVGAGGSGGAGTFSVNGKPGTAGYNSSFKGDTVTVRAHAGKGATINAFGNGGTGSTNTAHFNGGHGASSSSGFGGGGGGGSGGNATNGAAGTINSGNTAGGGAAAVTDGGPGGGGGTGAGVSQGAAATPGLMPFPGPGGGGGGGGFNDYNDYGKPGGGGQAGQVRITFGQAAAPNANVLRLVANVPSGGGVDGATLGQIVTSGTVANLQITYHTASGGSLALTGKNAANATIISSGTQTFAANGAILLISAELTQNNPTTVGWKLTAITPNATAPVATYKGTVTGTLGSVTQVNVNNGGGTDTSTGIGHIAVQYAVDPILNLAGALAGYAGELAATRFVRLCNEALIPVELIGNTTDTPAMGVQPDDLLINLLQDCEAADLGLMFEPRDVFGLGYRTRVSLQGQVPAAVISYPAAQLAQGIAPTDDEQLIHNDVIVTRTAASGTTGSTYETILTSGAMSVSPPPNGIGQYVYTASVNLSTDSQLTGYGNWLLILGTVDEFRWPVITIDLARSEVSDGTFYAIPALDVGAFLQIVYPLVPTDAYTDTYSDIYTEGLGIPPAWLPPPPINQLCAGFTETINAFVWTVAVNAIPADPYLATSFPDW